MSNKAHPRSVRTQTLILEVFPWLCVAIGVELCLDLIDPRLMSRRKKTQQVTQYDFDCLRLFLP